MGNIRQEIDKFLKDPKKIKEGKTAAYYCNKLKKACKQKKRLLFTHSAKFSHPSAKVSSAMMHCCEDIDGYLRSGNVKYDIDAGPANYLSVAKFLLTITDDSGQTVLQAFQEEDQFLQEWCEENGINFFELEEYVSEVAQPVKADKNDTRVKQVYFPLDITKKNSDKENYHLLSILSPSGLMSVLKDRIQASRNELLPDLNYIKYGGDQPQNIGLINKKCDGEYYLLSSTPPPLDKRTIRLPHNTEAFFVQCFSNNEARGYFQELHTLIVNKRNDQNIRAKKEEVLHAIIDCILSQAERIYTYEYQDWEKKNYKNLNPDLRILIDNRSDLDKRDGRWVNAISTIIARAIIRTYRKQKEAEKLGDTDLNYLEKEVKQIVKRSVRGIT